MMHFYVKNVVEPDRSQMTIWRTRFACWINKATGTHSVYVILIILKDKNCYANAPLRKFIRTLAVLFIHSNCNFRLHRSGGSSWPPEGLIVP
jgi:hypothetical protein